MFRGLSAFNKGLKGFAEGVPRGGVKAIREEARNWFAEVVSLTPVDTGFASSKWKFTINKRPSSSVIKHPNMGSYSAASTPAFSTLGGNDTLYIYNNASNISALEKGHSSQAPANFFNSSQRRAKRRLENAFRSLRV